MPTTTRLMLLMQMCLCVHLSFSLDYTSVDRLPRRNAFITNVAYTDSELKREKRESSDNTVATENAMTTLKPLADTVIVEDGHDYYNSSFYSAGEDYFIDLTTETEERIIRLHEALSETHLTAGAVSLPFEFPFYGHNLTKVYVATGGFLSLSTFFHHHLSATQYIAPLMGNFDPSLNGSSLIKYAWNKTSFTVEWDDIHVQHIQEAGRFTFQTTLMSDGRIIFAYKEIPQSVLTIAGGNGHKVTVGLADGYYIDRPFFPGSHFVQRTIYQYHSISINKTHVKDGSAVVFTPLPTCNTLSSCKDCLGERDLIQFDCSWCGKIKRCSSGLDRHRQEWLEGNCPTNAQQECHNPDAATTVIVIVVVIIALIILAGIGFGVYAYKNPSTRSGQVLVQCQQRVRNGIRRRPQDNYQESIVANMQESKPTNPPPPYTPPQDTPPISTPPIATPPMSGTPVIATAGAPGAIVPVAGNGIASAKPAAAGDIDANAQTAEC